MSGTEFVKYVDNIYVYTIDYLVFVIQSFCKLMKF